MNRLVNSPALNSSVIFWLFIILSLLAHSLVLLINQPTNEHPAPPNKLSSLEITLQPPQQATASQPEQTLAAIKTPAATPKMTPKPAAVVEKTVAQQTTPVTAGKPQAQQHSGVQISIDALKWAQQQANSEFDRNAAIRQIVSYGVGHRDGDHPVLAYRDGIDRVNVVFNTELGRVCATIKAADPLDSFDQGTWTVNSVCRG